MTAAPIVHQPDQHRFVCDIGKGEAVITYRIQGNTVDFDHTSVPFSARGHGLAAQLVDAAAAWARSEGLTITASCWYARDHLHLS